MRATERLVKIMLEEASHGNWSYTGYARAVRMRYEPETMAPTSVSKIGWFKEALTEAEILNYFGNWVSLNVEQ